MHTRINRFALCLGLMLGCTVFSFSAHAQDYLKDRVYDEDPDVETPDEASGDVPTIDDQARELRIEQRILEKKKAPRPFTDHDPEGGKPEHFAHLLSQAQSGNGGAVYEVARAYDFGFGTKKNETLAVEWYKRAIDYGFEESYSAIGRIYQVKPDLEGGLISQLTSSAVGKVKQDDAVALNWFEKGVYSNDSGSYMQVAVFYRDGLMGYKKDSKKANWYYKRGLDIRHKKTEEHNKYLEAQMRREAEQEEGVFDAGH